MEDKIKYFIKLIKEVSWTKNETYEMKSTKEIVCFDFNFNRYVSPSHRKVNVCVTLKEYTEEQFFVANVSVNGTHILQRFINNNEEVFEFVNELYRLHVYEVAIRGYVE